MPLLDIPLTKSDFANSDWEGAITNCEEKECWQYGLEFWKKAVQAETEGNTTAQAVFTLLAGMASPMLKHELGNSDEPFAFMEVINSINDQHLDTLKEWAPEISDAELRSRVADILWIRKRDFRMAQLAVSSYLEAADTLEDPENWTQCFDRILRATKLAASLGRNNQSFSDAVAHIEAVLDKYNAEDPLFLSAKLMELLQEYRQGDFAKYAVLAGKAAAHAESKHNWYRARSYWEVKARWHVLEKDPNSERVALLSAAETYVKEAEAHVNGATPSYTAAYTFLEKAIEALRRVGGTKERQEELHKKLIEYQERALAEMTVIYTESVNIAEASQRAVEEVRGCSIHDAFFTLASMGTSPRVSKLREQVQRSSREFIFYHLVNEEIINEKGKVVAHRPSMLSTKPEEVEEATRAEMFKWAKLEQRIMAEAVISPALYQINLEHNVQLTDWLPIVSDNPLIPPGRELLYARGLHAGLKGDFLVAIHILILQLEESIRHLFHQEGFLTSTLRDGIQNERDLNNLLYSEEITRFFSENILFDLQGLLVSRFGSNLRNRLAHGLIENGEFYSPQMQYLWWLTLRLCCLPILARMRKQEANPNGDLGSSAGDEIQE